MGVKFCVRGKMRRHRINKLLIQWLYFVTVLHLIWTTGFLVRAYEKHRNYDAGPSNQRYLIDNRRNPYRNRMFYSSNVNYNQNSNPLKRNQSPLLVQSETETNVISSAAAARQTTSASPHLNTMANLLRYNSNRQVSTAQSESSSVSVISKAHSNKLSDRKLKKKSYPPRPASVNSILRLEPEFSMWDKATSICRTIPGLTRQQMELCFKNPETTEVALQGLSLAADECAYQMSKNRWNCSSLQGVLNPHNTLLFKKGYRESAFGHAISAAGVAYSVAKACSQGNLLSCGCGFQYDDQVNYMPTKEADYGFDERDATSIRKWMNRNSGRATSWKWSGCSHNMDYGVRFAKMFLDSREKYSDIPSRINIHNNRVGRMAVSSNMKIKCKCHGLSGSCEMRTCWRSSPDFRHVGTVLKNKFRRAVMIDHSELGNRPIRRIENMKKKQRRKRRHQARKSIGNIDLWYYERSPTYCDSNSDFSIPGTSGRICNRTLDREMGSCSTLCCGRGYNTIRQVYTTRCHCQFIWCCEVVCKNCTIDQWITVCK